MAVTKYITVSGDRWDTVAWKAYGDATKFGPIIRQNPGVRVDDVLPSGLTLFVPVLDRPSVDNALLPPWKR